MMVDYYVLLGVGMDSSVEQLQQAIDQYAAKSGNEKEVKTMRETLLNAASKANYDMFLTQNYPNRYAK